MVLENLLTAQVFPRYNPSNMKNDSDLRIQLNTLMSWYYYFSPPA